MKQDPATLAMVEEAKQNLARPAAMILDDLMDAFPWMSPAELLAMTAAAAAYYWTHMSPGYVRVKLPRDAAETKLP